MSRLASVRRSVSVAGYTGDEGVARAGLDDPAPAVRAAALSALARMGALEEGDLRDALNDTAVLVRRRACDLAGRYGPPGLRGSLVQALSDAAPSVVEAACYALGELESSEVPGDGPGGAAGDPLVDLVGPLAFTAGSHPEPLCREAAVAALGALGSPKGLAAVLAAMGDKPTVRRRAVAALAAFEGEEVERALSEAARDRDWQVRQLAEDLRRSTTA